MSAHHIAKGIRRTPSGFQVYTKKGGTFRQRCFPKDTALAVLKTEYANLDAIATLAKSGRKVEDAPMDGDHLAADVSHYEHAIAGMTTVKDRVYRIRQWRDAFGGETRRQDITPLKIRQQLERWRKDGKSAGTLNLYRTALMHFFTVTDPEAPNPVKRVPRYRETPKPLHLPTIAQATRAISKLSPHGKSRARLLVLLWTGWPPSQLMRLTKFDLHLKKQMVRVPAREKGAGVPGSWKPILPQAVTALRAFDKLDAYGEFSTHSLRHRLHEACKKAKVKPFRVYDLRHLFLTTVAIITKDDRLVAELAQHSDLRQTRRYTEQSVDARLLAGMKRVTAVLGRR